MISCVLLSSCSSSSSFFLANISQRLLYTLCDSQSPPGFSQSFGFQPTPRNTSDRYSGLDNRTHTPRACCLNHANCLSRLISRSLSSLASRLSQDDDDDDCGDDELHSSHLLRASPSIGDKSHRRKSAVSRNCCLGSSFD